MASIAGLLNPIKESESYLCLVLLLLVSMIIQDKYRCKQKYGKGQTQLMHRHSERTGRTLQRELYTAHHAMACRD